LLVNYETGTFHLASQNLDVASPFPVSYPKCDTNDRRLAPKDKGFIAVGAAVLFMLVVIAAYAIYHCQKIRSRRKSTEGVAQTLTTSGVRGSTPLEPVMAGNGDHSPQLAQAKDPFAGAIPGGIPIVNYLNNGKTSTNKGIADDTDKEKHLHPKEIEEKENLNSAKVPVAELPDSPSRAAQTKSNAQEQAGLSHSLANSYGGSYQEQNDSPQPPLVSPLSPKPDEAPEKRGSESDENRASA